MKELVEVIAKSLVDYPEQVTVDEIVDGNHVLLKLRVASADMGKVIGKQGRIAKNSRRSIMTFGFLFIQNLFIIIYI